MRGIIDLLFEHEGRTWVLDWKTDRLPSYDDATLQAHAEEHYAVQARLYALGVARMLQIRDAADHEARFGGVIYCFVRGLGAPVGEGSTPGLHLMLPTFSDLERWDRALRTEDAPWGHPLPPRPAAHPGAEVAR